MRSAFNVLGALVLLGVPAAASAQTDTSLIQTSLPLQVDRGRNVSVVDKARPDYDPLGLRQGSFLIFPKLDLGLGATNNVYLTETNRLTDGFVAIGPSLRIQSDLPKHQLILDGGARLRRYFSNAPRNQDEWYVNGLGRGDIGDSVSVTVEGQAARVQEDPFYGQSNTVNAALSSYVRTLAAIRGQYTAGHIRAQIGYNHQTFNFNNIELTSGALIDQSDRSRDIDEVSGQLQYAVTPASAFYGQLTYDAIGYNRPLLNGLANRDSTGLRIIGGISLDLTGLIRGVAGIGFSVRNYASPLYKDVSGFSAEARIEYFRSEQTTFTIGARRAIEDSNIGITSAYFDNRLTFQVDHELLSNLLVNASAEYGFQDYIGTTQSARIWRTGGRARYLVSRLVSLTSEVGYGSRHLSGPSFNTNINELQGTIGVALHR